MAEFYASGTVAYSRAEFTRSSELTAFTGDEHSFTNCRRRYRTEIPDSRSTLISHSLFSFKPLNYSRRSAGSQII